MANSYVTYTGDGTTDTFAVTFPYILKAHVKVYVAGVLKTEGVHYSWPTSATIQFGGAYIPVNGAAVRIQRFTERDTRIVVFADAAQLTESDLNTAFKQDFYLAQESFDSVESTIPLDVDNKWNAGSKVIKNVADPVNPQDAMTYASALATLVAADASAQAAAASAAASASSASAAATTYDSFDDRYLGSKTSDPTLDNDGNALLTGALYWNSVAGAMRAYNGSAWVTLPIAAHSSLTGLSADDHTQYVLADGSRSITGAISTKKVTAQGVTSATTTNDQSTLEVRNNGGTGDSDVAAIAFHCTGSNARKLYLRADGYMGIGGWSHVAWQWYVDPSSNMVTAGNVTAYSDIRYKTDFAVLDGALDKVCSLTGYTFKRTDIEGPRQIGLIAQDVIRVFPEAVIENADGKLALAYGNLVAPLVEAIKELRAEVEALKAQLKR